MTTLVESPTRVPAHRAATTRPELAPIPMRRIAAVELRKMFDTRAGFWLMLSIGVLAVLATGAVILFAPDESQTYDSFAGSIGVPMAVILPMIAVLSVTSEYSQRTALTTFTLVPRRGRVVLAKALVTLAVGVASMAVAFGIGALGNLLGTAISGTGAVWDIPVGTVGDIVLANVLGMMIGFMLGVVLRSSAAAIVGYFVWSLLVPTVLGVLASYQAWFRDLQPWVDFNYAQTRLFDGGLSGIEWAHLGVTGLVWLVLPVAIGVRMVLRAEVK